MLQAVEHGWQRPVEMTMHVHNSQHMDQAANKELEAAAVGAVPLLEFLQTLQGSEGTIVFGLKSFPIHGSAAVQGRSCPAS